MDRFSEAVFKYAPWSFSMANMALNCSHAFHTRYVLKTKPVVEQAIATLVGTVVHKILEKIANGATAEQAFMHVINDPGVREDIKQELQLYREGIYDFERDLKTFKTAQQVTQILTEQKFAVDANFKKTDFFNKRGTFRGVTDLVLLTGTKNVITIDHKTGDKKPIEYHLPQVKSYAILLDAIFHDLVGYYGVLHFVGAPKYGDIKRTSWSDAYPIEEVRTSFRVELNDMLLKATEAADNPKPNVCWLCEYCGFKPICPAHK